MKLAVLLHHRDGFPQHRKTVVDDDSARLRERVERLSTRTFPGAYTVCELPRPWAEIETTAEHLAALAGRSA